MSTVWFSAPGKLILCGEHAVVYGRSAIALPLSEVRARATVEPLAPGSGLLIDAPDLGQAWAVAEQPDEPLSALVLRLLVMLDAELPDARITLHSAIPIASGMGSGAAIATALCRALAGLLGANLAPAAISALVYESERYYHGTPSGIDNTVVAYERPIWYRRNGAAADANSAVPALGANPAPAGPMIELLEVGAPLQLVIGDSGVRSETRLPVGELRRRWQHDPARYEALFDQVGALVEGARAALMSGDAVGLGRLLDANHGLLVRMGVSSPQLDGLVAAARAAGALGAKLSGGGWGGVMLALTEDADQERVAEALRQAGATRVLKTCLT